MIKNPDAIGSDHCDLSLKSSTYHYDSDLILMYKSKLLSYLKYRIPAVYHATDTLLESLDEV